MDKNGSMDGQRGNLGVRVESIKDNVKDFVHQGQAKVDQLKSRAIDVKDRALSRGGKYVDRTSEVIKAHPLAAVGIAFGIGYVGMRLFRR